METTLTVRGSAMTFREKLRELRDQAGLSEAKLAEVSGVAFGALHKYGLGIRKPPFEAVIKITKALGVSCEVFAECEDFGGSTSKPAKKRRRPRPER